MTAGERPLVGRGRELDELGHLLDLAEAGRGAVCLLTGEPGIGKTALAGAFAEQAAGRATVLWGACWAGGAAPAYWPWRQALRGVLAVRDAAALRAALGPAAAHAGRLLPELGAAEPPEGEGESSRFALFDGVAGLLATAGGGGPLLIVLDDLHDADAPSIALLEFLARALAAAPVLFVGTAREREAALREDVATALTRIGPHTRHLPLRGLGRDDVAALVAARAPAVAAAVAGQFVAALHERTNGNPFFIDELLALAGDGAGDAAQALPAGVRDAIRARVAPLPLPTAALLGAAAVVGLAFGLRVAAAAAGMTGAEALGALEPARALGIVAEAGGNGEPRFAFDHALVRETLYEDLPVALRAELHRTVGEFLEARLGDAGEPPLAELAHHFARAVAVCAPAQARYYAALAGARAMAVSAWEDAARHFAAALELHAQEDPDEERRCDLLLALGRARTRAGDPGAARPMLLEAAAVARQLGAARRFALAAIELGAVGLPPGDVDAEMVALLQEALDALDERPSAVRARVLARLAVQQYWTAPPEEREALAARAATIADGLTEPADRLDVLAQVHLARSGPESQERLADLERLLGLAGLAADPETELQVRIWRVAAMTQLGDLRGAAAEVEAFARLSARVQQPRWEWYVPLLRGVRALVEGRLDDAERLREEAAALGLPVQGSMAPLVLGALLVATRWTQRELGDLLEPVTALTDAYPAVPGWRCVRVAALVDAGHEAEARAELRRLVPGDAVQLPRDTTFISSAALLADAAARLGDAEAARALYAALLPYATHNASLPSGGFLGPVARHLGVLAATFGDREAARGHLAVARAAAEAGDMRAMLAWIEDDEAALGVAPPAPPAAGSEAAAETEALLRREGDVWTVSVDARTVRVRHAKGLSYLAALLARPGQEVHALDLVAGGAAAGAPGASRDDGLHAREAPDGDLGPVLDAAAKAAYRERMAELSAEIEEAEAFHDPERAARAREELEALADELRGAIGLGGRDRRPGSSAERARVNATRAIRSVLKRIAEHDELLGRELEATVRTGTFCSYEPDPRRPLRWSVHER